MSQVYPKCQWVVAYRTSGSPLPGISVSIPILSPLNVTDSVKGIGYGSIQLNIDGDQYGFQNVLKLAPDQLIWNFSCFDKTNKMLEDNDMVTINDLNIEDLNQVSITLGFWPGNQMYLSIYNTKGQLLIGLNYQVPYSNNIISGYFSFCGWGDSSESVWSNLSSQPKITTDYSVTDLAIESFPLSAPVPITATEEGSNTHQQALLLTGNEIILSTQIGPWA